MIVDTNKHKNIILNDSITVGSDWEITAFSPNVEFVLNVQKTVYFLGQEIQFQLRTTPPPLTGTYTFILLNSDCILSGKFLTSISLPSSPLASSDKISFDKTSNHSP